MEDSTPEKKSTLDIDSDTSSPIRRLLAIAQDKYQDVVVLAEILWLLNIHPDLPGFALTCSHVQEILSLVSEKLEAEVGAFALNLWASVLAWIATEKEGLAKEIFPDGSPDLKEYREKFLRTKAPNPLLRNGKGITQFGMHGALWSSHPTPSLRAPFRLLQAHLMLAHISVMRYATTIASWNYGKGADPTPGFYEAISRPGWAVRRFTCGDGQWDDLLDKIEIHSPRALLPESIWGLAEEIAGGRRSQFADLAATEEESESRLDHPVRNLEERALRTITSFLDWGLDPAHHKTRLGGGSGGSGGGEVFGGAGDEEAELPVGDGENGSGSNLHLQVRWRRDTKGYKASIKAGDHPGEANSSQEISLADDFAGAAFATGGGVEMANQLLPWAYNDISAGELAPMLTELQRTGENQERDPLELMAVISVMLWVGASLEQAVSLQMFTGDIFDPACEVALRLGDRCVETGIAVSEWWVRALKLEYKPETLPPPDKARNVMEFIPLPDTVGGTLAVRSLVNYLHHIAKDPTSEPDTMAIRPQRVFTREIGWYKQQLKRLFDKSAYRGRISASRIGKMLFQTIIDQTGGDVVSASLITCTDHYLASVRRHYVTPRIRDLQRVYGNACSALRQELADAGYVLEYPGPLDPKRSNDAVGSQICPTISTVQKAIRDVQLDILGASSKSWKYPCEEFVARHNLYTFYTVALIFGIAVVARGVRTPYLHSSEVDWDPEKEEGSGLAVITDKDSGIGYKSRLVWIPPLVLKQMNFYESYLSEMAQRTGLDSPTRKRPCYFLSTDLKIVDVRPATMEPILQNYLPFAANAGRHFGCTELRERGLDSLFVDAMMGHWWRGEEPWGIFSGFSFAKYRDAVQRILPNLLKRELGLKPIEIHYYGGRI
jgi:hypothetical protein